MPILATQVGHFPETIKEGENRYLAEPDLNDIVSVMKKYLDSPISPANVDVFKENLSWKSYIKAILKV